MNNTVTKLGRYQIVKEIGRGAMGVVYKAYDPVIEREVAIKAIRLAFQVTPEEKQTYLNRFYREAKAAGKLNHANIVTIYDVDEDKENGTPFIVMEYLEGTTLQEIIAGGILLPLDDVNSVMIQIADALNYAHKNQVVHRDVKSANILILSGMKAKIMDFGIARLPSSDLTQSGQFMGTPNYMSPEQVEGKSQLDGRSDLFSLGIILYLLLTGERPFSGDTFTAVSYKIAHVDPLPPTSINPSIPLIYNRIVAKLLAKDPTQRYKSGQDLIDELKKIEKGDHEGIPMEATDVTAVPALDEAAEKLQDPLDSRSSIASRPTVTLFRRENFLRLGIALSLIAVVVIGAVMYPSKKAVPATAPPPPVQAPAVATAPQAAEPQKPEAAIRSKMDLAMNYYQNGFYDRCIQELNGVLDMDPDNAEAKRYLQMARDKKVEIKEKPSKKRPR